MAARVGIELSPSACRIVQIERARKDDDGDTIVRSYAVTPSADAATLALYKGVPAAVVVWGLQNDHRQAVVTVGSYARMRREAVSATRSAGVDTRHMLADIAPVSTAKDANRRRPVVIALARTSDVADALKPLTSMGVRVKSVVTPALALMSLARLRHRSVAGGTAEAYVALEQTATAIALIRDGALIAAREVPWGFQDAQGRPSPRDEVAARLSAAVREFLEDCGAAPSAVGQMCVCGGMPELRNMTLGLMERLDIEVEPLDSLFGIDEGQLPAEDFRERAADMRLAWAVASDASAPINFLRERRRRLVKSVLTRAAIVAGVASGLGIAWRVQQSSLFDAVPAKPSSVQRAPERKPKPAPAVTVAKPSAPEPKPASPPNPTPPVVARSEPPPRVIAPPPPVVVQQPPPAAKPAPPSVVARVPAVPPVVLTPVPEPRRPEPRRPEPPPPEAPRAEPPRPEPPRAAVPRQVQPPAAPRPSDARPASEIPTPFEGTLGTILYGSDRKLAIVDGRIVQVGDEIRGARVVEITPNSVLFRDKQGQLRRLGLDESRR